MSKLTQKVAKQGRSAARKAYDKLETRILAAEGRRSIKAKTRKVTAVGKKAAKAALAAGALAVAGVVVREIRGRSRA